MAKENNSTLLTETLCSAVPMLIVSLFSIAFYGVIELTLRIIITFKRRRGLYFWSLIIATWGIGLSATGSALDFGRVPLSIWITATISLVGWVCMVSGQAVVLYSRLHLVLNSDTGLRAVLILIITNAVVWHTLIGVLYLGSQSSHPSRFLHIYNMLEKAQLTVFALQEILISGLYIHSAAKFVGMNDVRGGHAQRKTMKELVFINTILIVLDIVVVSLQYANLYDIQISFKVAVYSIKLRLEFDILNRLVRDSRRRSGNLTSVSEFSEDQRGLRRRSV